MLSRVANSIYWMSRYVERAEHLARFVEVTLNLLLDQPDSRVDQWVPLVRATGDEKYFEENYREYCAENVQQFLTFDKSYHSSIHTAITCARENARTVREAISSEAWEQLNQFYHFIRQTSRSGQIQDASFYEEIVQHSFLFNGILDATMTRGTGWHFANVGRMLERADKTSRILDVKYFTLLPRIQDINTTADDLLWSSVLRSVSAFEMFRKQYHALTVERVVEFLILNRRFPRSVRYSVQQARNSLIEVEGPVSELHNTAIQKSERLIAELDLHTADSIIAGGMHEFIDSVQQSVNEIGDSIHDTYFAQRAVPEQMPLQQSRMCNTQ